MAPYGFLGASSSSQAMHPSSSTSNPITPPRPRPASRRSASAFQASSASRPPFYNSHRHHNRTASSSTPLNFGSKVQSVPLKAVTPRPHKSRRGQMMPPVTPSGPESPRFSRLLSSVLGSPFLTTSDPPLPSGLVELEMLDATSNPRPPSPVPSLDFSIIDVDPDDLDGHFSNNMFFPGAYPTGSARNHSHGHGRSLSTPMVGRSHSHPADSPGWTSTNYPAHLFANGSVSRGKENEAAASGTGSGQSPQNPFKALLPRIWDAISSPGRAVLNFSPAANVSSNNNYLPSSSSSSRAASPSPHHGPIPSSQSWYHSPPQVHHSGRHSPVFWSTPHNKSKGKSKAAAFFSRNGSRGELSDHVNYSELLPLDGEEGELIDDEACFIDVRAVTGIDILALLPPEVALHILILLCPSPLDYSTGTQYSSPRENDGRADPCGESSSLQPTFQSPTLGGSNGRSGTRTSPALCTDAEEEQNAMLHAILACRSVSHTWRRLASDNAVWRALFLGRWGIDLQKATPEAILRADLKPLGRKALGPTWDYDYGISRTSYCSPVIPQTGRGYRMEGRRGKSSNDKKPAGSCPTSATHVVTPPAKYRHTAADAVALHYDRSLYLSPHRISYVSPSATAATTSFSTAPLQLDWRALYKERLELDRRWAGTVRPKSDLLARSPSVYRGESSGGDEFGDREMEMEENIKPWEPEMRRMHGHTDSVYCLEFDSQRIMTGSRDRTIKVWSLKTGQVLGTFRGAHTGSVLCLKFERDWDRSDGDSGDDDSVDGMDVDVEGHPERPGQSSGAMVSGGRRRRGKGFLVSGSSDCSICVWDLELGAKVGKAGDREVKAEVRAILKGHEGGVLDLRMDDKWIVSCSKDASIRVWDRNTLKLARILRGHEGPVNAIGFQNDKVVSASGDGKLILWDVINGERMRTFEGHDRGLACIEFKDNLIVSGSNDCKIKVWDPWTGECLRTLVGHDSLVRALSFDPRTGRLVSVSYDKTVKVWDLRTGKLVREFKKMHSSHIFDVKFDVARIVTTSHDHQIITLDFSAGLDTLLFI